MTTLQENQLRVLNETIAAYTINTRCITRTGRCVYHVDGKQGCAVGRLIPDIKLREELDNQNYTGVHEVFDLLPKEVQELGVDFLFELQILHDKDYNWDENGLAERGKQIVEYIKIKFQLS